MKLNDEDWDKRFSRQASWTEQLRKYIYERIGLNQVNRIIEIGCGTGAIIKDLLEFQRAKIFGLDISERFIRNVQQKHPNTHLSVGDAHLLPLKDNQFDVVICHFFLLWVENPLTSLREMIRIVRNNGYILILAEPDYGGRIDYPDDLNLFGDIQIKSLIKQGADPFIGRRLGSLFFEAGISLVEMGILGGQWYNLPEVDSEKSEWQMLLYDLSFLEKKGNSQIYRQSELGKLWRVNNIAKEHKTRVLYVPTFYAVGQVI